MDTMGNLLGDAEWIVLGVLGLVAVCVLLWTVSAERSTRPARG